MSDLQWETNGGLYRLRCFIQQEYLERDKKYAEYFYKRMKEELGFKLFDILQSTRNPVTIEYKEFQKDLHSVNKYKPGYGNIITGQDGTEIIMELHCTPVTYRDVVIPRPVDLTYSIHEMQKEKQTFISKLLSAKLLSKVIKTLHK